MNSYGQGNVNWVNLSGGAAPGAPTDANEGLTLIGGFVQLGVPAPDITRAITVPREIQVSPAIGATLAICTTGGSFTGNVFFYDDANGIHIDGRQSGSGGQSTRYNFNYTGIQINATNPLNAGVFFNTGFPVGTPRGHVNLTGSNDLQLQSDAANIEFNSNGGVQSWLGDIGYGFGLNLGYDAATQSSAVTFQSATQPEISIGMLDFLAAGMFSVAAWNTADVFYPIQIDPTNGYIGLAGSPPTPTVAGGLINIGSATNQLAQINFGANGVLINDGDFDYNGTVLRLRTGGFNFNMIGTEFNLNPGQIPFGSSVVSGMATRDNSFAFDQSTGTLNVQRINTSGQTWSFGAFTPGAVTLDNANYIEVIIAGVNYKLLVST